MGSASNEMMPQPNNRIAITATRKRLLSAKSTRPRIIVRSLLLGVLQDEGVLNHALPGLNARPNLLHIAGEHIRRSLPRVGIARCRWARRPSRGHGGAGDRKSTRLNSSHRCISYA